ncbi:hypothetical protein C1646_717944 [Rhizophagus diaphanus]|nr:hypothetical protein C1646_717944 [Rhizophagus diaphanus] [Rhizophagus sp. MUCL 43196]
MDISSSSRTRDLQSDSSIIDNTTNVNTVTTASTLESFQNDNNNIGNITSESSDTNKTITELSQPTITITPIPQNNSSLVLILDEVPPPPYHTDSNIQIPTPSHSRDHTTITLTSPPDYTSSASIITTQPQPQIMSLSPNNNRLSDISMTNSTNEDMSNRALLNEAQQLKFCKICQESEESSSSNVLDFETYKKGKLISPCKCKGSLQYVHIGCLNQWRHSNVRAEASYRCEVCKYEYRFYRPRIAKIFSSNLTLHFLTLTLLLSIIYLMSYIVKLIMHNNVSHDPNDPNNDPPHKLPGNYNWREIEFLNIRVIEYLIGITLVSCFGLIFFLIMICLNGFSHTRHSYCYIGGCDNSFCLSYGGCSGSDCSGTGNDCSGIFIILFLFIISIIFMVGCAGATIAAYLLIQKIISICLGKVHDRILEVNKD